MSTIKKSLLYSLIAVVITVGGVSLVSNQSQPASAQEDEEAGRQADLEQWQEQIQQWQKQQAQTNLETTDMSEQGISQLPNTGPSN